MLMMHALMRKLGNDPAADTHDARFDGDIAPRPVQLMLMMPALMRTLGHDPAADTHDGTP